MSVGTQFTYFSDKSQDILETVSLKSEGRLMKLQENIDQNMLTATWTALGLFITRQLKLGRGVKLPKFGVITFSAPEVKLEGVTNPNERDIRIRKPVFIVSKEFGNGRELKAGIMTNQGIRPYSMSGVTSGIPLVKVNFTELGVYAGLDKDTATLCCARLVQDLSERAQTIGNVEMDIPQVGIFYVKNGIACIEFHEPLVNAISDITNPSVKARKMLSSSLSAQNIQKLLSSTQGTGFLRSSLPGTIPEEKIEIEESAIDYLKSKLDIDYNDVRGFRPHTAEKSTIQPRRFSSVPKLRNSTKLFESNKSETNFKESSIRFADEDTSTVPANKAIRKVKLWMRNRSFLPEDAYYELVSCVKGPGAPLKKPLSLEELQMAAEKTIGLDLDAEEIKVLFEYLDDPKTGVTNYDKWKETFVHSHSYLTYIKDIIYKYKLNADDLMKKMEIDKNTPPLDRKMIATSLTLIDPSLSFPNAVSIALEVLNGKKYITVNDFMKTLGYSIANGEEFSIDEWFKQKAAQIQSLNLGNKLKELFEELDKKNEGLVLLADFKMTLYKNIPGMTVEDVNRLTRSVEKDSDQRIDYYKFLEILENNGEHENEVISKMSDTSRWVSQYLVNYLRNASIKPIQLLHKIAERKEDSGDGGKKVTIEDFANFVEEKILKSKYSKKSVLNVATKIDIDNDGYIGDHDLQTFLERYGYLEPKSSLRRSMRSSSVGQTADLFPKEPLSEERLQHLLRELHQVMDKKRMSYSDFIRLLDPHENGTININDFNAGLDKLIKFSAPAKDGLFAYLDHLKIGIIDYASVLRLLKRSSMSSKKNV